MPIPFMEVETAWARVAAYQAPAWMSEDDFYRGDGSGADVRHDRAVQRADPAVG